MRKRLGIIAGIAALAALLFWCSRPAAPPPAADPAPVHATPAATPADTARPTRTAAATPDDVECEVELPDPIPTNLPRASLVEHDEATTDPIGEVEVRWADTWLVFAPRHAEGIGMVTLRGFEPAAIGWSGGACLVPIRPVPLPSATIVGVVDEPPAGVDLSAWSQGCGGWAKWDVGRSGRFEMVVYPPEDGGTCELNVGLTFGSRMRTNTVEVAAPWGEVIEVPVALPELPSVGWDLLETDDGFRVAAVLPGSAAARAGIAIADRVVAVGEVAATELPLEELHELPLPAVVSVSRDGEIDEIPIAP